jgi:7-cyano-7-deazaguanine synthase
MTTPIDKPVILLSGGLDSATTLAIAKSQGYACYTLSVDYGQRHRVELQAAQQVAESLGSLEHKVIHLDLNQIGGSALTDLKMTVPIAGPTDRIPITYVPARNTVLLALALGWAEVLAAYHLFIGVNAVDYSGYPDCRPEFIAAFEKMANLATQAGVEGHPFKIHTPLIHLTKAQIIQTGLQLGIDYGLTISCYQPSPQGHACGLCDACRFRAQGFQALGIEDPTRYLT